MEDFKQEPEIEKIETEDIEENVCLLKYNAGF
jgi:hypothetical protein